MFVLQVLHGVGGFIDLCRGLSPHLSVSLCVCVSVSVFVHM